MKAKRHVIVSLFACLVWPAAPEVQATSFPRNDLGWVVDESDLIFVGVVRQSNTRGDRWPAPEELYTYYQFKIERILKGTPADSNYFWIRIYGANFGGGAFRGFAGTPWFDEGKRYLLFVKGNGSNVVPFVHWSVGVIRVRPHPRTGDDVLATRDGTAIGGISPAAGGEWRTVPETLDETAPPGAAPRLAMARSAVEVLDELAAFIHARSKTPTPGVPTAESSPPPDHLIDLDAEFQRLYGTPQSQTSGQRDK